MIIVNVPFTATIFSENIDELNNIVRDEGYENEISKYFAHAQRLQ